MSKKKKTKLILSILCAVCALYVMYDGLTTAGHGTLSVCEEHAHTSDELLVFLGIGTAVFFLGAFLSCAAIMLLRSPTVRLIYLSAFGIVFSLGSLVSLATQIPGLTEHASSCTTIALSGAPEQELFEEFGAPGGFLPFADEASFGSVSLEQTNYELS